MSDTQLGGQQTNINNQTDKTVVDEDNKPIDLNDLVFKTMPKGFDTPKNYIKPESLEAANKIIKFLDALEDLDDVQNVYSNVDFKDYANHVDFGN